MPGAAGVLAALGWEVLRTCGWRFDATAGGIEFAVDRAIEIGALTDLDVL